MFMPACELRRTVPPESAAPEKHAPGSISALLADLAHTPSIGVGVAFSPELRPGARVDRFELLRELGRGAFGVVFEARDTSLGRLVAFKVVRSGRTEVAEDQLRREAETIARLAHPNLVTLYDFGRCAHGSYLVLELLRGQTLSARLARGPLSPAEAVVIAVDVTRGLAWAHAHGVVHRDLKPSNIFLVDGGGAKVLDFGLAQAFGRRRLGGGTPNCMAPEQWREAPEDERTDVFALGVVLFRMLTGQLPFPNDEGRSVLGPEPAPRLTVPNHPDLARLIARMLEKDPVQRPRDGAAVLAGLLVTQAELSPPEAGGPAAGSVRIQPRWRRWTGWMVAGAVTLLAVPALAAGWFEWQLRSEADQTPSVAVLPFIDLSERQDQRYLSDGLAEEIVVELTRLEGLRVTGQVSASSFRDPLPDLRKVGRDLDVGTVLEGSVRRDGGRVRVTAQLVKVSDGYHLWSRTFDRDVGDLFAVQDEIVGAVVQALQVRLLAGREPSSQLHRTANPEVYAQYLLGRQLVREDQVLPARQAVAAYRRALALDPTYAPAWAGLSQSLFWGYANIDGTAAELKAAREEAMAAAEQAVTLTPELAEAFSARGFLRASLDWDWIGARSDFERAVALEPGNAEIRQRYARNVLAPIGLLADARAAALMATRLDPLSNSAWSSLAAIYLAEGELGRARRAASRSLELQPRQDFASTYLSLVELVEGRPEAALQVAERCNQELFRLQLTAAALHSRGRRAEAQAALDQLIARHADDGPFQIATVYAWRGEPDQAFWWLERALSARDGGLMDLRLDPLLRGLIPDPRFKDLLARLHLPAG
jgi:eukaryotic-like serine/threonine-protein kinase